MMKNKNSHLKHGFKIPSDYFEEFKIKHHLVKNQLALKFLMGI